MAKWVRYLLIVLETGGGFAGFTMLLMSRTWSSDMPFHVTVGSIIFAAVYFLGIISGLAMADNTTFGRLLSAIYQLLQIPMVVSPTMTYSLFSGAQIKVEWWPAPPTQVCEYGARFSFAWMNGGDWRVGVNVLALVLFFWLLWDVWKRGKNGVKSGFRNYSLDAAEAG